MKTKALIATLQEADPTGEMEVAVGNTDIYFVDVEPAYYDGCLQVLKHDPALVGNAYSVIGAEFRGAGDKIVIHTLPIEDALWDNPDMPITFDGEYAERHYASRVADWRNQAKE